MNFTKYKSEDFACDETFQKYCLGEGNESTVFWESWIQANPDRQDDIEEAKRLVNILSAKQGRKINQLNELQRAIQQKKLFVDVIDNLTNESKKNTIKKNVIVKFIRNAGGIAALLVIAMGIIYIQRARQKSTISQLHVQPEIKYQATLQKKTVLLPDGSIVVLNKNSTLTLAAGYSAEFRELKLVGEAYFDVKHDEQHPLTVHTASLNVKVLGTAFNVRAYPGQHKIETALIRGKVVVTMNDQSQSPIILKPNQKVIVEPPSKTQEQPGAYKVSNFAVMPIVMDPVNHKAEETTWTRKRLQVVDEPLESIAKKMEEWYGVNIVFANDAVKRYRYTGTFEDETVPKVLDALQLSYPFKFEMRRDSIFIK
ncbi:FecR family protein [Solitalea koreensis]|uniref:FecR family protein n=1 Tax=Solitalea koreensis TaxID=543615 RepID=A0A521DKC2_9SPHI|nr:FecR domain-containing protein [Solitalea koreensis]SMO72068.1 FecR family protein [Solitalea koreensis]